MSIRPMFLFLTSNPFLSLKKSVFKFVKNLHYQYITMNIYLFYCAHIVEDFLKF